MRVMVVGVGALGSYFGGALAAQGHDVTMLIRNRAHRNAIREYGLILRLDDGETKISPHVVDSESAAEAGVADAAYRLMGEEAARGGTYPSRVLGHAREEEAQAGFLERIDFILLSPAAMARATAATMPRGGVLDEVSDHYPVTVTLGPRPDPTEPSAPGPTAR